MSSSLGYRADVDVLRAIAVLGVVVFHLDEAWLPGGYAGVDIFFVISGFLITTIISRELDLGTFSFGTFYRRRILRIAPAYFVVTLATLLAGCFLLLPGDLRNLAESAAWSAVSLPNVYFWAFLDTGYFAAESEEMPLLHLWSLGVEEQFYLLWPLSLFLLGSLRKRPKLFLPLLAGVAAASFVHAQQTAVSDPSYAYYMLPARAGELLVGALVAFATALRPAGRDGGWVFELAALVGLALIGGSYVLLDGQSVFPGYNALYPCLGTALVIYAGSRRDCLVPRLLAVRPVLWIGLVSYSLYLWHWPILAYVRYFAADVSLVAAVASTAAMLALSALSYRYVEIPFRSLRAGSSGWRVPVGYVSLVLVLMAGCGLVVRSNGMESAIAGSPAYVAGLKRLNEYTAPALDYEYNCQMARFEAGHLDRPECVVGAGADGGEPRVLIVGDSNAAHYIGVVGALAEKAGMPFRNASFGSCAPVFSDGKTYGTPSNAEDCARFRALVRERVGDYDYVLLGGQWTSNMRRDGFRRDMRRTVREIARSGATVVLLGQVPLFPAYDRSCELRRLRLPLVDCEKQARESAVPTHAANRFLRTLAERIPNVYYVEVADIVCGEGGCSPYLDGVPVYFDRSHFSMAGSWRIGRKMVQDQPQGTDLGAMIQARSLAGSAH